MRTEGVYREERIIGAVRKLLAEDVNELLEGSGDSVLPVEFAEGRGSGRYGVAPEIRLACGERSEKDRVVLVDAYTVTITFVCMRGECSSYPYAWAVDQALRADPTLDGVVDRVSLVKKTWAALKYPNEGIELTFTLRVTVEGMGGGDKGVC
jgi:hypothetical protein